VGVLNCNNWRSDARAVYIEPDNTPITPHWNHWSRPPLVFILANIMFHSDALCSHPMKTFNVRIEWKCCSTSSSMFSLFTSVMSSVLSCRLTWRKRNCHTGILPWYKPNTLLFKHQNSGRYPPCCHLQKLQRELSDWWLQGQHFPGPRMISNVVLLPNQSPS
jgi:hypothetical protein